MSNHSSDIYFVKLKYCTGIKTCKHNYYIIASLHGCEFTSCIPFNKEIFNRRTVQFSALNASVKAFVLEIKHPKLYKAGADSI